MKNTLLLALILIGSTAIAQEATFDKKAYQFNNVEEGTMLTFNYYFTNTGSKDLVFKLVKPTCGCTVAEAPKGPIKPGQRDSIQITFDTNGRPGYNAKGINILSNIGEINLVFEAEVIANNDAEEPELEDDEE